MSISRFTRHRRGRRIVAAGRPEQAVATGSRTGDALRAVLVRK